jgi:hypothetical protein
VCVSASKTRAKIYFTMEIHSAKRALQSSTRYQSFATQTAKATKEKNHEPGHGKHPLKRNDKNTWEKVSPDQNQVGAAQSTTHIRNIKGNWKTCNTNEYHEYQAINRPWENIKRAGKETTISNISPMERWEHESIGDQPWNVVGGISEHNPRSFDVYLAGRKVVREEEEYEGDLEHASMFCEDSDG